MKFDLYSRISTDHQDVDQQMVELRRWCIQNNHTIASETFDIESGTIPLRNRKQFKALLDNPKGEALLVFNLDRLSRNWGDEPILEQYFIQSDRYDLVSTKDEINLDNANGRLMFRIKFAVNCQYVEDMKEKQAIGIARAKANGVYKGRKKGSKNKK